MDTDFQSQELDATNNFSNPMYESYGVAHTLGSTSTVADDDIVSANISTDTPETSPTPVKKRSPLVDDNSNAKQVLSSDAAQSPSPILKKRGFFSKMAAASPLKKHVTFPRTALRCSESDDGEDAAPGVEPAGAEEPDVKEFSPTSVETDKDTQALVEEDF